MTTEALAIFTAALSSPLLTTLAMSMLNKKPMDNLKKKMATIEEVVNGIALHIKEDDDIAETKKKFRQVQAYFAAQLPEGIQRDGLISKTEEFIRVAVDYAMELDFDDIHSFVAFRNYLHAASQRSRERMTHQVSKEALDSYYKIMYPKMAHYAMAIQRIFFSNTNSKKAKVITASLNFLQCIAHHYIETCKEHDKSMERSMEDKRIEDDCGIPGIICEI